MAIILAAHHRHKLSLKLNHKEEHMSVAVKREEKKKNEGYEKGKEERKKER